MAAPHVCAAPSAFDWRKAGITSDGGKYAAPELELQPQSHSPVFGNFQTDDDLREERRLSATSTAEQWPDGSRRGVDLASARALQAQHAQKLEWLAMQQEKEERSWLESAQRAGEGDYASRGPAIHYLLYADHARRLERKQQLRNERERELAEQDKQNGPTTRIAPKSVEEEVVQRLHGEAEQRRLRHEERKQRKEYIEDLQVQLAKAPRAQYGAPEGGEGQNVPHWERMYRASSVHKAKVEELRRKAEEEERRQIEETRVHRSSGSTALAPPDEDDEEELSRFERLYLEGKDLLRRKEELRQAAEEEQDRALQAKSVHQRNDGASWQLATRRLYGDRKLREERLEEIRRGQERMLRGEQSQSQSLGGKALKASAARLHGEAERRDEVRHLLRSHLEEEELQKFEEKSVHSRAKDRGLTQKDLARISDRLSRSTRSLTPPPKQVSQQGYFPIAKDECKGGCIGKASRWPSRRRESEMHQKTAVGLRRESSAPVLGRKDAPPLDDNALAGVRDMILRTAYDLDDQALLRILYFASREKPPEGISDAFPAGQSNDEVADLLNRTSEKRPEGDDNDDTSYEMENDDVRKVVRFIFGVASSDISDAQIASLCSVLGRGRASGKVTVDRLAIFLGLQNISLQDSTTHLLDALETAIRSRPPPRPGPTPRVRAPTGRSRGASGAAPRGGTPARGGATPRRGEISAAQTPRNSSKANLAKVPTPPMTPSNDGQNKDQTKSPKPSVTAEELATETAALPETKQAKGGKFLGVLANAKQAEAATAQKSGRSPRRGRSPKQEEMQIRRNPDLMAQLVQQGALMGFPGAS